MIKCKHSTGLFIKSSYMNQVNSLTSIPHEPIVVVHKATMVANYLHKTGIKWGTVTPENKKMVPAGLNIAETMDTGDIKNCGMTQEPWMFCEESLGKVNAKDLELFRNRLVHEFYCLKVLITLEQVVEKKKNLNEQNFDQWGTS